MSSKQRSLLIAIALCVFVLALTIRWGFVDGYEGRGFHPGPDSLEYAAAAQEIAHTGTYRLEFGSVHARPRYAPGLPLLLSIPAWLGFGGEDLMLLPGLFSAWNALVLATIAFLACGFLMRSAPKEQAVNTSLLAFTIAGIGWAFCPISIVSSRSIMSDEATALFGNAGLALLLIAFFASVKSRHALVLCFMAGACIAIAGALRPVSNYLMVGPGLLLLMASVRLHGLRPSLWRSLFTAFGMAPVVLLVMWLLQRSGEDPWAWSAYGFWVPESYPTADNPGYGRVFDLAFALHGNPEAPFRLAGRAIGHLEIAFRLFFGMQFGIGDPGAGRSQGLGLLWPWLGWASGAWLLARGLMEQRVSKAVIWLVALALTGWILGHVLVYSLYFFPAERFYMAPLSWCWVFAGVAIALALREARQSRWSISVLLTLLMLAVIPFSLVHGVRPLIAIDDGRPHVDNEDTRRMFARWLGWSDQERAHRFMPFDPVRAQALGLFDANVRGKVQSWGKIPVTGHRQQLIEHGLIPELDHWRITSTPLWQKVYPQAVHVPGRRRVQFDPGDNSYRLWLEDLEGRVIVAYRVRLDGKAARNGLLEVLEESSGTAIVESAGLNVRLTTEGKEKRIAAQDFAFLTEHSGHLDSRLVSHGANHYQQSARLEFEDRYTLGPSSCKRRKIYLIQIIGRSLMVRMESHGDAVGDAIFDYEGVSAGRAFANRGRVRLIAWPLNGPASSCSWVNGRFTSRIMGDRAAGPRSGSDRRTLWLTSSPDLADCLPVQKSHAQARGGRTKKASPADMLLRGEGLSNLLLGNEGSGRALVDAYLLDGLRKEIRRAGRLELVFEDGDGNRLGLEQALSSGMGPDNSRLVFESADGLRIHANKGPVSWRVPYQQRSVLLPPGGCLAVARSGSVFVSAMGTAAAHPFFYAYDPMRSEVLDTQGSASFRAGKDSPFQRRIQALLKEDPSADVVIRDFKSWSWIRMHGSEVTESQISEPRPRATSLRIDMVGDPVLSLGRMKAQLDCIAEDAEGHVRELGAEVEWSSVPLGLVKIDEGGNVVGKWPGKATLIAKAQGQEARMQVEVMLLRVSDLRTHMMSAQGALVSYETDVPVRYASLLLQPVDSWRKRIHLPDSDPSGRVHMFELDALESGRAYRITMVIQLRPQDPPMLIPVPATLVPR